MIIIGAGLSGCIAALLTPEARVLEAGDGKHSEHQAVLRFRDPQIGRALGIPFTEVRVTKSAWFKGRHWTEPNPLLANLYARKVTSGRVIARSIGDLRPVTRYVAPGDLHRQMLGRLGDRVRFNARVDAITKERMIVNGTERHSRPVAIVSTMPLKAMLAVAQAAFPSPIAKVPEFSFAPVYVTRWHVPGADVHQTVYFPAPDTEVYRATLTGAELIVEAMGNLAPISSLWTTVAEVMGLAGMEHRLALQHTQRYGKIVPLETAWRKRTLYLLTSQLGIYSLGRFALWSNLLLDDVYDDLSKIKRMIDLRSDYDCLKAHTQETAK